MELFAEGHQAKVEDEPNRKSKNCDGEQTVPNPGKIMCLDGEDHDHQIICEASVAEKSAVLRILAAQAAEERQRAESDDKKGDEEVDGKHRVEFEVWAA